MADKPLLSVAFVFQNQRDVIEPTLDTLYDISAFSFELFVIDDGSTDGTTDAITSLLDYYQHEHTFFFSHNQPSGRGNALNEVLLECNGSVFWAPETLQDINENLLARQLKKLNQSSYSALVQDTNLPTGHDQWLSFLQNSHWPQDSHFIWNLSTIASGNRFFNPYLQHYHSLELAARLGDSSFMESESWHTTNSFLESPNITVRDREEIIMTLLRQTDYRADSRESVTQVLEQLQEQDSSTGQKSFDNNLLSEAENMKKDGRFNAALELIEEVLQNHPNHQAASQLKIEVLEKKRRFVEASELKHEVSKSEEQKPRKTTEPTDTKKPKVSLIIPTTAYGKPALEHCLLSISEHCDTSPLELIVIDNASLDNTHDYLDELQEKQFLDCTVITHPKNVGFAASVNRGLEKANGKYACVLHNDVEFTDDAIAHLTKLMDNNPQYAVMGPSTNKTLNPDQAERNVDDDAPTLIRTEYLDSFCMMIRTDANLQMDEEFEMAFFEDIDFCFQARSDGHKVGLAPHINVKHHLGTTTFSLDLDTNSEQYWKNIAYFNEKWNIEVFSEEELKSLSTFDQLLALDELVNPLFPEEKIIEQFHRLFTDELKTEILKAEHDDDTICRLVHLFMVMEEREIMRRLEDQLDDVELSAALIFQLVRFYYERNIYSRCLHYLDRLKPQNNSLRADLYRLAINVDNKNLDDAIPKLKYLMDEAPSNPMVYKLAGDIHRFNNNQEEAQSFYKIAEQINPFEFANEKQDTFGFSL
ncbi:glycosyltransferase [Fodinibius salinus]|nr:glycosyltransferase [Fodinibius salinus]